MSQDPQTVLLCPGESFPFTFFYAHKCANIALFSEQATFNAIDSTTTLFIVHQLLRNLKFHTRFESTSFRVVSCAVFSLEAGHALFPLPAFCKSLFFEAPSSSSSSSQDTFVDTQHKLNKFLQEEIIPLLQKFLEHKLVYSQVIQRLLDLSFSIEHPHAVACVEPSSVDPFKKVILRNVFAFWHLNLFTVLQQLKNKKICFQCHRCQYVHASECLFRFSSKEDTEEKEETDKHKELRLDRAFGLLAHWVQFVIDVMKHMVEVYETMDSTWIYFKDIRHFVFPWILKLKPVITFLHEFASAYDYEAQWGCTKVSNSFFCSIPCQKCQAPHSVDISPPHLLSFQECVCLLQKVKYGFAGIDYISGEDAHVNGYEEYPYFFPTNNTQTQKKPPPVQSSACEEKGKDPLQDAVFFYNIEDPQKVERSTSLLNAFTDVVVIPGVMKNLMTLFCQIKTQAPAVQTILPPMQLLSSPSSLSPSPDLTFSAEQVFRWVKHVYNLILNSFCLSNTCMFRFCPTCKHVFLTSHESSFFLDPKKGLFLPLEAWKKLPASLHFNQVSEVMKSVQQWARWVFEKPFFSACHSQSEKGECPLGWSSYQDCFDLTSQHLIQTLIFNATPSSLL